jgi:ADP-heptose:LPS heptosyltransferase
VAPSNILILKPCCLGDVLMTTPVLAALRRAYPHARISYAVGQWSRQALANNPNVDQIIDCGTAGNGPFRLSAFWQLSRELRRQHFDLAVVLDRSPAIALLPFMAGIARRAGLDSGGRGFAHTVRVSVDWHHPKHEAELYLDCVRALGITVSNPQLEFFPSASDRAFAAGLLELQDRGLPPGPRTPDPGPRTPDPEPRFVAVHPGGAANPGMTLLSKRWSPEGFAAVADRLVDTYGARILLVGAPSDAEAAEAVRRAMRHAPVVLTGKTNLGQLAALYERCLLMLGNDSGVMHLAVATGIAVVAVFGPSDPRVYGPYGGRGVAVRKDAQCAGRCFAPGHAIATHCDRRCIEGVTVDDVWAAVQDVLSRMLQETQQSPLPAAPGAGETG